MRCREEAAFCTALHQKPNAVCHSSGLKPPSVYLQTYVHIHLLQTHNWENLWPNKRNNPPHTHTHTRDHNSLLGVCRIKRETNFLASSQKVTESDLCIHVEGDGVSLSSADQREWTKRCEGSPWYIIGGSESGEPYGDGWGSSSCSFCSSVDYSSAELAKWCVLSFNNLSCHWEYAACYIRVRPSGHKSISIYLFSSLCIHTFFNPNMDAVRAENTSRRHIDP